MIERRKQAFDNISRILAITRYDIEHHQLCNDQSLNIHGENYFRDIFNFIYNTELENANFETSNAPCIDLIDKKRKLAYQITTTRDKEKIEKTLSILSNKKYKNYTIKVYYLLEKAKPIKSTIKSFSEKYNFNVSNLLDYTNLIKDMEKLETNKLIQLNKKYFKGRDKEYTNEIILDLVFKHLLKEKNTIKKDYDDDFGTIDINKKIKLNNINSRISIEINRALDYRNLVENVEKENILTDLRSLVIGSWYKKVLIGMLESRISKNNLLNINLNELHQLAIQYKYNFNKIIHKLHNKIESKTEINDFNSADIAWIIIAYFFEICDVGVHKK